MAAENDYQLLPDDYCNEVFEDNLDYFKTHQPGIFEIANTHRCTDYRLCVNPDGSPNILHIPSQSLLYYSEAEMNTNSLGLKLQSLPFSMEVSPAYAMTFRQEWYEKNPITTQMYQRLFELGPIKLLADDESRQRFNNNFRPDFIPFIRICGIGLGSQIIRLIETRDILSMVIYEPEMDLFFLSFFTLPWRLIFTYMALDPARRLSLIVDEKPQQAVVQETEFLVQNFPFIQAARWQLNMFKTASINEFIELEKNALHVLGENLSAGWYEDQKSGLVNGIENLIAKRKVYRGNKVDSFLRIAIVGAGPSLDDSIGYLKQHAQEFIIFACGTAITSLLKNDVVPDYHIHQERTSDASDVISWAGQGAYKDITALKLNVLSTEIDDLYKESYIFQKYNDPASSLLEAAFPAIKHVNPTVTNSAIAFAAEFEANEVYLFGVDYGAAGNHNAMHATHYIHAHRATEKVDKASKYRLAGNFSETVISTAKLVQSHNEAEVAIARHSKTRWFNVGHGAKIKNAKPVKVKSMPKHFNRHIDRTQLQYEISRCFDNGYPIDSIINDLQHQHGEVIGEYFSAVRECTSASPSSRSSIVNTLCLMYQVADVGKGVNEFIPHKLYSAGMKRFIENVYIQINMFGTDTEAVEFFSSAMQVLANYIDELQQDMNELVSNSRCLLEKSG